MVCVNEEIIRRNARQQRSRIRSAARVEVELAEWTYSLTGGLYIYCIRRESGYEVLGLAENICNILIPLANIEWYSFISSFEWLDAALP